MRRSGHIRSFPGTAQNTLKDRKEKSWPRRHQGRGECTIRQREATGCGRWGPPDNLYQKGGQRRLVAERGCGQRLAAAERKPVVWETQFQLRTALACCSPLGGSFPSHSFSFTHTEGPLGPLCVLTTVPWVHGCAQRSDPGHDVWGPNKKRKQESPAARPRGRHAGQMTLLFTSPRCRAERKEKEKINWIKVETKAVFSGH